MPAWRDEFNGNRKQLQHAGEDASKTKNRKIGRSKRLGNGEIRSGECEEVGKTDPALNDKLLWETAGTNNRRRAGSETQIRQGGRNDDRNWW
jgi:hypothetical protein